MHQQSQKRNGLSQIEVVMSTILVSLLVVGSMQSLGVVIQGRMENNESANAQHLASRLLAEILENEYLEPVDTPTFGRESGESGVARTDWDDVDDYHTWSSSPPKDRNGVALPNTTGLQRDVVVAWVDPNNPANVVGSDQGVKRVTVTVRRNSQVLATKVGLRSDVYTGATP
jgi:hypothetical protein